MKKIIEEWKYDFLPEEAKENITTQYVIGRKEYDDIISSTIQNESLSKRDENKGINLFEMFAEDGEIEAKDESEDEENSNSINLNSLEKSKIIWATDSYINSEGEHHFGEPLTNFQIIRPRTEKTLQEQKKRVKDKAEVFTPSWVCNLQNNLIDNEILGNNSFNKVTEDNKEWKSSVRVKFKKEDYKWTNYILEKRLEMCCGEGPYLFSRYDTTTGVNIPVRTKRRKK